jgi:hypothetical protein
MKGKQTITVTTPCCGYRPVVERYEERGTYHFQVLCTRCGRTSPRGSVAKAVEAWNRLMERVAPPPPGDTLDPETRALFRDRIARYRRGELAWQKAGFW